MDKTKKGGAEEIHTTKPIIGHEVKHEQTLIMSNDIVSNSQKKRKYKTLLVDPPWTNEQKGGGNKGAIHKYPLMSLEELKRLPIGELAEDNSHLWLWIVNAAMPDAFKLLDAWGFKYRSIMTYIKMQLGMGNYLRNCTEQLVLATRGKAPILYKSQPNFEIFARQEFSRKPGETYDLIERCSPGPYLELFARASEKYPKRPRWDYWGNEIESDIKIDGFPVPKYSDKCRG